MKNRWLIIWWKLTSNAQIQIWTQLVNSTTVCRLCVTISNDVTSHPTNLYMKFILFFQYQPFGIDQQVDSIIWWYVDFSEVEEMKSRLLGKKSLKMSTRLLKKKKKKNQFKAWKLLISHQDRNVEWMEIYCEEKRTKNESMKMSLFMK